MTSARKRRGTAVDAPGERNEGAGVKGVMKSKKRTTTGQRHKAAGKTDDFSVENDENCSPSSSTVAPSPGNPEKGACLLETTRKLPALDLYPGKVLCPSAKIKLQLFPIDEGTHIGLEKDGFHPYLELTLSTRKKISSVLKHLNSKWGSSSIAVGEPRLFPYNTTENLASYRWTMNDNDISSGDVHAALGNPAVFRMRYGWFTNSEAETFRVPSTSTTTVDCLNSEGIRKDSSTNMETNAKEKQIEGTSGELTPFIENGATNAGLAEKKSFDGAVGSVDNEVRMDGNTGSSSLLWADSLTNISIGGLLSEASLQGKFNNSDIKSNGSNAGLQPSLLISDSFDAFLASQINHSQGPRLPPQESRSSILDAEDTCHAFAFQKFSSSGKDAQASGGNVHINSCSQIGDTKTFKFPHMTEANIQSGMPQGHATKESETDLLLSSGVYNDESSLGLSGIKWSDSLGPFDLGLSSSRKIISGDSISMSGFVN